MIDAKNSTIEQYYQQDGLLVCVGSRSGVQANSKKLLWFQGILNLGTLVATS